MSKKVEAAVQAVRDAKDEVGAKLSKKEYVQFLEELSAEAAGWQMELEEAVDE